jgi:hypothetical protein
MRELGGRRIGGNRLDSKRRRRLARGRLHELQILHFVVVFSDNLSSNQDHFCMKIWFLFVGLAPLVLSAQDGVKIHTINLHDPRFITTIHKEMMKGDVLKSLGQAKTITAQLISSEKEVDSPTSARIEERSEVVQLDEQAKARVIKMLSLEAKFQDYGDFQAPCLCIFQPQLRLLWRSEDGDRFGILVNGLSHGEIRTYNGELQLGTVRIGAFIPDFLDVLDEVFPAHETSVALRKFHREVRLGVQAP